MFLKFSNLDFWFILVVLVVLVELSSTVNPIPAELELIMVHSIWRHGDRSQDGHLNNDPVDPSKWIKGGGGYGQLTPEGMEQHFILGKKLNDRYIKTGFLHDFYDSQQIYIRSTDYNRTINSAFANMLGMFSTSVNTSRPGIDYPDIQGWPRGFMPVPIHTGGYSKKDCVVNAYCHCKRRDLVQEIAHTGQQFQTYINSEKYKKMTKQMTEVFNSTFTYENLWQIHDLVLIQLIHFKNELESQPWYTHTFHDDIDELVRKANSFGSGLYNPPIVNKMNVKREIVKTRGGSLANEISTRMRTKARCARNSAKCDDWHRGLKYFVYSTHDHTVFALLVVLGIEDVVAGPEKYGEWPDYASDILIELFHNKIDKQPYFRILYQNRVTEDFKVVTQKIKGCGGKEFCDLKIFENAAKEFRPDRPINEFCETPLEDPSIASDPDLVMLSACSTYFYCHTLIILCILLRKLIIE